MKQLAECYYKHDTHDAKGILFVYLSHPVGPKFRYTGNEKTESD